MVTFLYQSNEDFSCFWNNSVFFRPTFCWFSTGTSFMKVVISWSNYWSTGVYNIQKQKSTKKWKWCVCFHHVCSVLLSLFPDCITVVLWDFPACFSHGVISHLSIGWLLLEPGAFGSTLHHSAVAGGETHTHLLTQIHTYSR